MKFLIFITPREFRDESLNTVKVFFDKWGVGYSVSSYSNGDCTGSHGAVVKPDINTSKADVDDYDGIVLVDGRGMDNSAVYDYRPLLDLVLKFGERRKRIIAIDNAVRVVARANVIKNRKIATPANEEVKRVVMLFHGQPTESEIEASGNVISIRSHEGLAGQMQGLMKHIGVA